MSLRIATCRPLPEPDPDEHLLLAALAARGVRARMVDWRDPREDWDAPVPTLLRSTWDYLHHLEEFLAWVERAGRAAELWNPPAVVRANVHKFYLRGLERRGIAIVPTAFLERGTGSSVVAVAEEHGWNDVVVKPAVSAGSFATLRARLTHSAERAAAEAHLAHHLGERDMLVQRYAPAVEGSGERALVWIAGEFTHSVRKRPRFLGQEEHVSAALPIEEDERALGEAALAPLRHELLYARVDVVRDDGGRPIVMELELCEPSLFLKQHPPALERLVSALEARLA
jgi:biotin carboxylase